MKKEKWLFNTHITEKIVDGKFPVEKTILQKWWLMDLKQWIRWYCSILTLIVSILTVILPILAIAEICVSGWDNSVLDGFISRIFTPYKY